MRKLLWKKRYWSTYFKCFFPSQWILYFRPSSACWVWLHPSYDPGCCHLSVRSILSDPVSLHTDGTHTHTQWGLTFIKKIHLNLSLIFTQICVTTYIHVSLFIEEEQIVSTQACPQFPWCLHRHKHKHRHAESKVRYQAGEIVDVKRKTEDSCPIVLNKDRIKKCTLITQRGNKWGSCSLSACECGIRESDLMSQA